MGKEGSSDLALLQPSLIVGNTGSHQACRTSLFTSDPPEWGMASAHPSCRDAAHLVRMLIFGWSQVQRQ